MPKHHGSLLLSSLVFDLTQIEVHLCEGKFIIIIFFSLPQEGLAMISKNSSNVPTI